MLFLFTSRPYISAHSGDEIQAKSFLSDSETILAATAVFVDALIVAFGNFSRHLRFRQGSRIRRPPQGNAAGYRDPDRRYGDFLRDRHGTEGSHRGSAWQGPPGQGEQGEYHDHRRRRRQGSN